MLVTPHQPAKIGQNGPFCYKFEGVPETLRDRLAANEPCPFFVDWLTIRQSHPEALPVVDSGFVQAVDGAGEIEWRTHKAVQLEGSHSTAMQVRCDGHTVQLSGNVSRFGRADNLFGLDLAGAIRRASGIVQALGLPPFTAGQAHPVATRNQDGGYSYSVGWTGARISRLDLTANYAAGSEDDAAHYMRFLATQQASRRIKVGTHGLADCETVDWGRGSRRVYAKAYTKHIELRRHQAPAAVVEHCRRHGVIRFEVTVKSTQLQAMGCHYLGGLHMGRLIQLFEDRRSVMTRATEDVDDFEALPRALRCTARDYLAGDNLASKLSDRTFRRHRSALLRYGIDIAVPAGVVPFRARTRVIELAPLPVPDWYSIDAIAA